MNSSHISCRVLASEKYMSTKSGIGYSRRNQIYKCDSQISYNTLKVSNRIENFMHTIANKRPCMTVNITVYELDSNMVLN